MNLSVVPKSDRLDELGEIASRGLFDAKAAVLEAYPLTLGRNDGFKAWLDKWSISSTTAYRWLKLPKSSVKSPKRDTTQQEAVDFSPSAGMPETPGAADVLEGATCDPIDFTKETKHGRFVQAAINSFEKLSPADRSIFALWLWKNGHVCVPEVIPLVRRRAV